MAALALVRATEPRALQAAPATALPAALVARAQAPFLPSSSPPASVAASVAAAAAAAAAPAAAVRAVRDGALVLPAIQAPADRRPVAEEARLAAGGGDRPPFLRSRGEWDGPGWNGHGRGCHRLVTAVIVIAVAPRMGANELGVRRGRGFGQRRVAAAESRGGALVRHSFACLALSSGHMLHSYRACLPMCIGEGWWSRQLRADSR